MPKNTKKPVVFKQTRSGRLDSDLIGLDEHQNVIFGTEVPHLLPGLSTDRKIRTEELKGRKRP